MSANFARPSACLLLVLLLAPTLPAFGGESVEVQIRGLTGELLDNVRASLTLERRKHRPGLSAGIIRRLHAQAPAEIARALEPFGYYRPDIQAELTGPEQSGGAWQASYRIDAGPLLPIEDLDIGFDGPGAADPKLAELAADHPLQRDSWLDHRRYEAAKRELLRQVREHGYLDAALSEHRVEVQLATYEARIRLRIDTGPRYVFGAIEFEQDRFDPEYLARYLLLQPGDIYSSAQLARQRQTLSKSGHFQSVEILPLPASTDQPPAIPLRIRLEPLKPNRFRGGVGWGTDTDFGAQLDWTRRYVGRRGQRFTLGGAAVQERRKLAADLRYNIPLEPLTGSRVELVARHESKDLNFEDVELDEGGETRIVTNLLSAFWHRPRKHWGGFELERVLGFSLVTENYDVFEVLFGNLPQESQDAIRDAIGPEAYSTLAPEFNALVPGLRLTLRRSDDRLFIRDGDYLNLDLLGASDKLGSNISFWQARLRTWHIRPLLGRGRLLLRSDFGYSDAESRTVLGVNFNQMPEYYEFRAGGVRSVRGYGYETLYPADAITGGKHQLVGSIEYEHEIIPDWSAAVFLDAGNAFNRFDDIDPKLGTGVGVRWRSPVGLARLDFGLPLDDADDPFQIYITVGPEF